VLSRSPIKQLISRSLAGFSGLLELITTVFDSGQEPWARSNLVATAGYGNEGSYREKCARMETVRGERRYD